jgi:hypothetical protein
VAHRYDVPFHMYGTFVHKSAQMSHFKFSM